MYVLCTLLRRVLPSRLHYRDNLVAQGKESKVSAAVVFLPQDTLHYGKCGSDKCYCVEVSFAVALISHTRRCYSTALRTPHTLPLLAVRPESSEHMGAANHAHTHFPQPWSSL